MNEKACSCSEKQGGLFTSYIRPEGPLSLSIFPSGWEDPRVGIPPEEEKGREGESENENENKNENDGYSREKIKEKGARRGARRGEKGRTLFLREKRKKKKKTESRNLEE